MSDAAKPNGAEGEHAPAPSASLGMTQENQGTWDRCVRRPLLLTPRSAAAAAAAALVATAVLLSPAVDDPICKHAGRLGCILRQGLLWPQCIAICITHG